MEREGEGDELPLCIRGDLEASSRSPCAVYAAQREPGELASPAPPMQRGSSSPSPAPAPATAPAIFGMVLAAAIFGMVLAAAIFGMVLAAAIFAFATQGGSPPIGREDDNPHPGVVSRPSLLYYVCT